MGVRMPANIMYLLAKFSIARFRPVPLPFTQNLEHLGEKEEEGGDQDDGRPGGEVEGIGKPEPHY